MINIEEFAKKYPNATEPLFCRDADDFYKFLCGTVYSADEQPVEQLIIGLKVLLHEYLALVLKGDFVPIQSSAPSDKLRQSFQDMVLNVTETMQECGIAMKEEDGRVKIDVNAMAKNPWGKA